MRRRGRRTFSRLQPRRPRDQQIERANAPAGGDDETSGGDIAAGPANALPRYRLRQHLNHWTGLIHEVGIEHAVAPFGMASPASTQTGDIANGSGE